MDRCGTDIASKLIATNIAFYIHKIPVVQTLDSAIHRIDHYPADKYFGNQLRYPRFFHWNDWGQSVFFEFLKYLL